jgi:branched-chain amino acid transport system substrate-binding protein
VRAQIRDVIHHIPAGLARLAVPARTNSGGAEFGRRQASSRHPHSRPIHKEYMMIRVGPSARVGVTLAVAALVIAGCSSSGKSNSAQSSDSGTSTQSSGTKAAGIPISVGFYNQENSSTINYPDYASGTRAAISYINNELGGVDGHPIDLATCKTAGTPESSQNCAQQLVAKKPLFILGGLDYGFGSASPVFNGGNIPVIGGSPFVGPDYVAKDTYFWAPGAPPTLANMSIFAAQVLHAKKVAVIYDNPSVASGLPLVYGPLDAAGVKHIALQVSGDSADFSGAFSALKANDQDVIITLLAGASSCIKFAQAQKAQQNHTPTLSFGTCRAPDVLKAVGNAEDGWYYSVGFEDVTKNPSPDMKIMIDSMQKYEHSKVLGLSGLAFAQAMTVYAVLKAVGYANLTAANLRTYLTTKTGTVFTGPEWKCPGLKKFPTVCAAKELFYQVHGNDVVVANGGKYLDPSAALGG